MFQQHEHDVIRSTYCLKQQHSIVWARSYLGRNGNKTTVNMTIYFISTIKAQPISIVKNVNSQVHFQYTTKFNNILETNQTKTKTDLS